MIFQAICVSPFLGDQLLEVDSAPLVLSCSLGSLGSWWPSTGVCTFEEMVTSSRVYALILFREDFHLQLKCSVIQVKCGVPSMGCVTALNLGGGCNVSLVQAAGVCDLNNCVVSAESCGGGS